MILYVHSRFYRQTPPCCPLIVHEEELRPSSQTDSNRSTTQQGCVQIQRLMTLKTSATNGNTFVEISAQWTRIWHFISSEIKLKSFVDQTVVNKNEDKDQRPSSQLGQNCVTEPDWIQMKPLKKDTANMCLCCSCLVQMCSNRLYFFLHTNCFSSAGMVERQSASSRTQFGRFHCWWFLIPAAAVRSDLCSPTRCRLDNTYLTEHTLACFSCHLFTSFFRPRLFAPTSSRHESCWAKDSGVKGHHFIFRPAFFLKRLILDQNTKSFSYWDGNVLVGTI